MSRKILLTGKTGQIGSELHNLLPQLGEVIALDRQELDLANPEKIRNVVRSISPHIIVNAAAYTAVDQAETDEATASAVNADAPGILGEEAQRLGALLVHYSTDYVFDGAKRLPYIEEDLPNPKNTYGRTKLEGEHAIQQSGAAHLIFRTSWIYSRRGRNFLLTVSRLATRQKELRIVQDQIGSPTWSREVAAATSKVLSQLCAAGRASIDLKESGIYHMTAAGETSWYAFAKAIIEESSGFAEGPSWFATAAQRQPIIAQHICPIATAEYPTPARRPAYSVLSNARLAAAFGVRLSDWRAQLHSCFVDG